MSIIYQGPSLIDGSPIVVIATTNSRNTKTGAMVQTWIIRADMDPITASRTGDDAAICGQCPHRGAAHDGDKGWAKGRTCYVNLMQGPLSVYRAFVRGIYPLVTGHKAIAAVGAGKMVRIGSYGDGAAVPGYIWESLCSDAKGWTAYTHQANPDASRYMTSADSLGQAQEAWSRGERTFRVIADVAAMVPGKEILCPASEEAGKRTQCASCKLCGGTSIKGKSIAIVAHGSAKAKAKAKALVA